MEHTLVEIKTGNIIKIDDSTPDGRKEYYRLAMGNKYMEWFCFGA